LSPACPSAVTFMGRLSWTGTPHAALASSRGRLAAAGCEWGGARGLSASGARGVSPASTRRRTRGGL
jgi:hypothetical protein